MGVLVSADLNVNGNPQIFGSDTFQNGSASPIAPNPLVHRIIIEKDATDVLVILPKSDISKTVDDAATLTANSAFIASVLSLSGLTVGYSTPLHHFTIVGTVTPNISLPVSKDTYFHDDTSAGLLSIYGTFTFVFTDTTTEAHTLFITSNETMVAIAQESGTNKLTFSYQDNTIDVQNPIDNWGVAFQGLMKYEYSLDLGTTWVTMAEDMDILDPLVYEFDNAYTDMEFRFTRTVFDGNNNVIYESIGTLLPGGETTFDMTDEVPFPSFTLSDLYCSCSNIDLIDASVYQNRQNWLVGLFTRNIVDGTPYYRWFDHGDMSDPVKDSMWSIFVPFNGAYTFKVVVVKVYGEGVTYGAGDWTFNPTDGKIYVSLGGANTGNALSDLVHWRQWNSVTDIETVFTKTVNNASGTFVYSVSTKTVTCNQQKTVQIENKKSCDSTCATIEFEDSTGVFDFLCNPYGYGPPSYRRDQYAQAFFLVNKRSDGTILSYTPATYNPLSAMLYMFDIPKDGWYRLQMYQVKLYDSTKKFTNCEIVYDGDTMSFYKSKTATNAFPLSNMDAWETVNKWDDFKDAITFDKYCWDHLVTCNSRKTLNDIGMGIIADTCCGSCKGELLKKYNLLEIYLSGAKAKWECEDFEKAQCLIEGIPKNCSPYVATLKNNCGC